MHVQTFQSPPGCTELRVSPCSPWHKPAWPAPGAVRSHCPLFPSPSKGACDSRGCSGTPMALASPSQPSHPSTVAMPQGAMRAKQGPLTEVQRRTVRSSSSPASLQQRHAVSQGRYPSPAPLAAARHGGQSTPDDAGCPLDRHVVHCGGVDHEELVTRLQLPFGRAPCGQPASLSHSQTPPTRGSQRRLDWKSPLRARSPPINPVLPGPPLTQVPHQH